MGGGVSLVIVITTFLFASLKFVHLVSRSNPNVSMHIETDAYGADDKLVTYEEKFMMAVAVEEYFTKEIKTDTRYIKYFA